ncbi:MAG TPA: PAS domain S-box protein, partial [Gemmatimonadaceae bacterium]
MAESGSGARDGLALSPALEPFKELLRQSPLAISIVNLDGRVLMWSAESERLFGWKEAEVIGRASPHVPTDGIAKNMEHILEAAAGRPIRGVEAVRTRRDGTRVNVLLHTAAIRDANGDVAGVMGMSVDVTERRQVEIRLRNAQKMEAVG